jgi:hypothetical protein
MIADNVKMDEKETTARKKKGERQKGVSQVIEVTVPERRSFLRPNHFRLSISLGQQEFSMDYAVSRSLACSLLFLVRVVRILNTCLRCMIDEKGERQIEILRAPCQPDT